MTQPGPDLFGNEPTPEPARLTPAEKSPVELAPAPSGLLRRLSRPCNLACGAPIVLAVTMRKTRAGEVPGWMPVDVEADPREGNVRLVAEGRGVRAYVIGRADERKTQTTLHRSHMDTCPNRHRLPKKEGKR